MNRKIFYAFLTGASLTIASTFAFGQGKTASAIILLLISVLVVDYGLHRFRQKYPKKD